MREQVLLGVSAGCVEGVCVCVSVCKRGRWAVSGCSRALLCKGCWFMGVGDGEGLVSRLPKALQLCT